MEKSCPLWTVTSKKNKLTFELLKFWSLLVYSIALEIANFYLESQVVNILGFATCFFAPVTQFC